MILKYPKLLNNTWLKEGCFIGVYSNPYDVFQVTSIIQNGGVKIKYKPYYGVLSLDEIYFIPTEYVCFRNNSFSIKNSFASYFEKNKDNLFLKYQKGLAQCNICKKKQQIVDYCGNGSFFCKQCQGKQKIISTQNIKKLIDINQPINYSNAILQSINLFSQICFQKMNDVNKIQKFLSNIIKIIYAKDNCFDFKLLNSTNKYEGNICKIKDKIFNQFGECFIMLHNGTKKDKYICFIYEKMFSILKDFIQLKNKSF